MQSAELRTALRDLVMANRILAHEGIMDGLGHISIRHPENPQRYFMARSRGAALVTFDDLMEYDLDSKPVDQRGRAMYAERMIHGCVFALRPDVNSVCHNHSHALLPFGITKTPLRPILHVAAPIGDKIPVWDIRDEFGDTNMLVTTSPQGQSLARAIGEGRVVLMRGHGATIAGRSLRETVFTTIYLQVNADALLRALPLGEVKALTPGEAKLTGDIVLTPLSIDRTWEYWCARAGFSGI